MATSSTAHATAYGNTAPTQWPLQHYTFGPYAATALAAGGTGGNFPIIQVPFDCEVEKITLSNTTAGTAGSIVFKVSPSATAPASGTSITAVEDFASNGLAASNVPRDLPMAQTGNPHRGIASGSVISFTTASTPATIAGLMISVVLKKTPLRRSDSGAVIY